MIKINNNISISEDELVYQFIRSPGPGGQNVNKVATAVLLRFNIKNSYSLSESAKERLLAKLANKLTSKGELLIKASRYRTQLGNKDDARSRLIIQLKNALKQEKKRKPTKPSKASVERRLEKKKLQAKTKSGRSKKNIDFD